jgi:predicted RNase H-like HicB family nuclease
MEADFKIGFELEADGRWIAEVGGLPGVLAYGSTREEAKSKVLALADKAVQEKSPDERSSHGSQ